jgi:hypothetical protein
MIVSPWKLSGVIMRVIATILGSLVFAAPVQAAWHKVQSPNFIVYSDGKPEQTLEFTRKVERFDRFLRGKFHISLEPAPYRLTIFLVGSATPSAKLYGSKDSAIKGFYTVGPDGPMAVVDRVSPGDKFSLDADTILFHEYVHHFMFQYAPAVYPTWFVEGFAEFYSTTEFDKQGRASYGRPAYHRSYDLVVTQAIPMEKMLTAEIGALNGDETRSLYARGWLLTHYLTFDKDRAGQFGKYMAALASGTDNLDAAKAAFGDLKMLDKGLNAYRDKNRISYLTQITETPTATDVIQLPLDEGEAAAMIERIKLMRRLSSDETPAVLAALEKARARFPKSAAIPAMIAEISYDSENDKEALVAANAALAINPAEPRAMLYKGLAQMREFVRTDTSDPAQWKAARALVVKANRTEPDNPYPLFHYYRSFADQGVEIPELALRGLARAQQLVPQDERFRFAYAQVLIREKRFKEALTLVKPVAFDPHGGSDYARNLVKRLEKAITTNSAFEESEELVEPGSN